MLFGDGAGAVVVSAADAGDGCILDFEHEIDGSGGPALCMPAGGSLRPPSHETVDQRLHYVKQDGATVFKFAVRKTEEIAAARSRAHADPQLILAARLFRNSRPTVIKVRSKTNHFRFRFTLRNRPLPSR